MTYFQRVLNLLFMLMSKMFTAQIIDGEQALFRQHYGEHFVDFKVDFTFRSFVWGKGVEEEIVGERGRMNISMEFRSRAAEQPKKFCLVSKQILPDLYKDCIVMFTTDESILICFSDFVAYNFILRTLISYGHSFPKQLLILWWQITNKICIYRPR